VILANSCDFSKNLKNVARDYLFAGQNKVTNRFIHIQEVGRLLA